MRQIRLDAVRARAYTIPTEKVESDGTLAWDATTIVIVHVAGGGRQGLGYSFTHKSAVRLINNKLAALVQGKNVLDNRALWQDLVAGCRNLGDSSLVMMAIAAVDSALWDLKAKILDVSLVTLLGGVRQSVPVYGSGGFTSYDPQELAEQLHGWQQAGMGAVKMKIGRQPERDPERVRMARQAIGSAAGLMVDANGAYSRKQALRMAEVLAECGVTWFEEPVPHRDAAGLHFLCDHAPAGMEITAGEYGFNLDYFQRLLAGEAVDVLQADASRCSLTVFMQAAELCQAHHLPFSSHTAPALHCHACCALLPVRHMEYFHDHVRIERLFFDGLPRLENGCLQPDRDRPGMGLILKEQDAEKFAD